MNEALTFDQLPTAVSQLDKRLENIERLLTQKSEPTPAKQPDQLLTVQQTAEFLSLAVPTVYSMVSRGELPVMKRSKRLYFSQLELTEYLKAGRKKSNAEIASEAAALLSNRKNGVNHGK
jgi:excisionase family DNA binding protein